MRISAEDAAEGAGYIQGGYFDRSLIAFNVFG